MATLIQSYEQQYSVLTADITAKIGRLKVGNEDDCDQLSKEILANFEEANDLLEQLELESIGASAAARVAAYRAELQRARQEYHSALSNTTGYKMDTEEVYEDWNVNEQRQKLLDNTECLERTGNKLAEGYRVAVETEQIGAAVLRDLNSQRETILTARERLRSTDDHLSRSGRLVSAMMLRALQTRMALAVLLAAVTILICLSLYFSIT